MMNPEPAMALRPGCRLLFIGDAASARAQLEAAGIDPVWHCVADAVAFEDALLRFAPDLVIARDQPGFSALQALALLRERVAPPPLLILDEHPGFDGALAALRAGASDYLPAGDPASLAAALSRALDRVERRRAKRNAALERVRDQRYQSLAALAGGLGHDLRNVLQPMLMVSAILKKNASESIRGLGEMVDGSAQRGLSIVATLQGFARPPAGGSERVSMAKLVQAVRLLLRGTTPDNVSLALAPEASELELQGDVAELQQCLLQLCRNAIQAMPDGGCVSVEARREWLEPAFFDEEEPVRPGPYLCVSVRDSGQGIDEKLRSKLFQPFFTTRKNGAGLGLFVCQRIVTRHRGLIRVRSEAGQGTCVDLYLPEAEAG
jgi:signal transduction histidine kinase